MENFMLALSSKTTGRMWFYPFLWTQNTHTVYFCHTGAWGYHRCPTSGGDTPVSRVLPCLIFSSTVPHTPPAPIPGSPSLHPQLSLFLPPSQSRGNATPPVLPAPPAPHVQWSRYMPIRLNEPVVGKRLWFLQEFKFKDFTRFVFSFQKLSLFMGCQTT